MVDVKELDALEARLRSAATYAGYREPREAENLRAVQALYVGLCVRDLVDTLVGRVSA